MNKFVSVIISLVFITSLIFAQSRPTNPTNSQKKNTRPTPSVTPTPETVSVNEDIEAVTDDDVLKIETSLVTVPVKVIDKNNRFIPNLVKEDFQIFEDGKEQEIAYFSNVEEPFTVALLIDMSYSTVFKTTEIQNAAIGFTAQLRPKDKVMVVSFDESVHPLCQPTTDRKISNAAIKQTKIGQGTSLYEAVDYVVKKFRTIPGRKAIILFTDGVDTTSRKAFYEGNLRDVEELDALIYPIQYDTYNDVQRASSGIPPIISPSGTPSSTMPFPMPKPPTIPRTRRTPQPYPTPTQNPMPFPTPTKPPIGIQTGDSEEEYQRADAYLQQLALRTGGDLYPATDKATMALSFSRIADQLRQKYSLGFYQIEGKEGQKRKLKVKVKREKTVVRSRDSYIFGKKSAKK
ncbi:MAG: VWA domain-containing protein [Pyrinomonadaceae bacterium]|nr:VWA domain-containing protein [Pyrinomonadaceae bacterium]